MIPCVILLLAAALIIVILNDRHKAYLVRRAEKRGKEADPAWQNNRTNWLTVLFILLAVAGYWAWERWGGPGQARVLLLFPLGALAIIFACLLLLWWRGSAARAAIRLAQAGDVDGALVDVRRDIENKGPSRDRLNLLGVLLCARNDFNEALAAFEEAEQFGDPASLVLANKGLALWKLGRLQEALPCFEQAYRASPDQLATVTNYCLLLADLGRLDEAKDKFSWAEHLCASQRILGAANRRQRAKMLEECRKKIWGEEVTDGD